MTTSAQDYYFPLPTMRPSQRRSLEFMDQAWSSGIPNVVLQLPVGTGKSPIAIAASRLSSRIPYPDTKETPPEKTWLLTTQKVLQRQYVRDFDEDVANIMSKTNYPCDVFDGNDSCERGSKFQKAQGTTSIHDILKGLPDNEGGREMKAHLQRMRSEGCTDIPCGTQECPYKSAFAAWIASPLSITNVAYFMNLVEGVKKSIDGKKSDRYVRELLIVDEAHLLDDEIIRYHQIELPKRYIMEELRLALPIFDDVQEMQGWTKEVLVPFLIERRKFIEGKMLIDVSTGADSTGLARKLATVESYLRKAIIFMDSDMSDWVICDDSETGQSAKPIHTGLIGPELILRYGKRRLLMSGTILDKGLYCAHLGLNVNEVAFYEEPSPFHADNRPVVRHFVGGMGRKSQDATTPRLLEAVKNLLNRHADEKGIIHTGSYRLNKIIMESVRDPRLVSHLSSKERDEALRRHYDSNEPTVLVSPSMTTGVDLKDDLARWGIICKVPFPYLGDARIKVLFDSDKRWYHWKSAQEIMQACGRIVRSNDDYGVMYILDSDFNTVLRQAGMMFPRWWYDGLVIEDFTPGGL